MNQELLLAVDVLEKERGYKRDVIFESLEAALLQAYKKDHQAAFDARVEIDRTTGEYRVFGRKRIVEIVEDEGKEISLKEAQKIDKDYAVGDELELNITPSDFGRSAAQQAKQMLIQRLREAERSSVFEAFSEKENDMITGRVSRQEGRNVFIDLGQTEAILPVTEQIPGEEYTVGKTLKCYLVEVKKMSKGPQIMVSRTHPGLLKKLFEFEVPEIFDGTVEIKSVAREPGERSKISVYSREDGIDPVGACVGPKGQRVQNIVDELCNEKIDIIKWDEDSALYIAQALSPAKVISVAVNDEEKASRVVVPDFQLSLAIGKSGQNARLAAKLTNWKIDIKSESQLEEEPFEDEEQE